MPQVNLEHWRPHVLAALHAKQPFTQYAREHGVSRHTLYVAHKLMKTNGEVAPGIPRPKRVTRSGFVPVRVEPPMSSALRVVLPNGLALHFSQVDAPLLALLAGLPCLS